MKELISIIVPIYRVEKYLRKCIDSIRNQTYTNLEIILVDDGSPDNCGAICDEYARKDSRIRVIHKPNGGLSDARNAGMDIMTGQYVAFIDSDDWIAPDWCEVLRNTLDEYGADMCLSGIVREFEQPETKKAVFLTEDYGTVPFCESNIDMIRRFFHTSWVAWDKLYRADLFENLRFPVGEINEDEAIVLQLLDGIKKVAITNHTAYHYLERKNSITTASFSEKKLIWAKHCRDNLAFIRKKYPQLEQDALARYRGSILWLMREIALQKDGYEEHWDSLRRELMENYNAFRVSAGKRDRILMILFRYFPRRLAYMVFTKRSK